MNLWLWCVITFRKIPCLVFPIPSIKIFIVAVFRRRFHVVYRFAILMFVQPLYFFPDGFMRNIMSQWVRYYTFVFFGILKLAVLNSTGPKFELHWWAQTAVWKTCVFNIAQGVRHVSGWSQRAWVKVSSAWLSCFVTQRIAVTSFCLSSGADLRFTRFKNYKSMRWRKLSWPNWLACWSSYCKRVNDSHVSLREARTWHLRQWIVDLFLKLDADIVCSQFQSWRGNIESSDTLKAWGMLSV